MAAYHAAKQLCQGNSDRACLEIEKCGLECTEGIGAGLGRMRARVQVFKAWCQVGTDFSIHYPAQAVDVEGTQANQTATDLAQVVENW